MRYTLTLTVLVLALPALSRAAEPVAALAPCHAAAMEGGIRGPVLSSRVAPRYPEKARADKMEGIVILEVVVGKDGKIGEAKALRADAKTYGFDRAAIEAVRQWKFQPATKNGAPVEVRCSLVFDFALEEEEATPAAPAGDTPAAAPPPR